MRRIRIVFTLLSLLGSWGLAQERNDRDQRDPTPPLEQTRQPGVDWDAKYEAFLKNSPGVAKAVESGKITKEKVIAGIKVRMEEAMPSEEEQLEAIYQEILREHPELEGRVTKEQLMPRLKVMLVERRRQQNVDGHAGSELRGKYAYKDRWTAEELTRAEAALKEQAGKGGYLKPVLQAIEQTLIDVHVQGDAFVVDPDVSRRLENARLTKEQIVLVVGLAQKAWVEVVDMNQGVSVQECRQIISDAKSTRTSDELDPRLIAAVQFSVDSGNRALKAHFDLVVEEGILTRQEADALLEKTKIEPLGDWDAKYEQFLKENPRIKTKVDSGEWTKEQVMTLIKRR